MMFKKIKMIIKILSIVIILLLLTGGFYYLHLRNKMNTLDGQIEKEFAKLRKAGFLVSTEEIEKSYCYPSGKNGADLFYKVFSHLTTDCSAKYCDLPFLGGKNLPSQKPLDNKMKKLISEYIQENKNAIELLNQATFRECRYKVDCSDGIRLLLPHLSELYQASNLLCLKALLEIENKNSQKAIQAILSNFRTGFSLENEPFQFSFISKINIIDKTIKTCERLLTQLKLDENQLQELSVVLNQIKKSAKMKNILRGEAWDIREYYKAIFQGNHPDFPNFSWVHKFGLLIYRLRGDMHRDFLFSLRALHSYMKIIDIPIQECIQKAKALDNKYMKIMAKSFKKRQLIFANLVNKVYGNIISRYATHIAKIDMLRLALAIEQYRLENNKLPQRLNMVSKYIPIPQDPYDSNSLRYKKTDSGYLIYSIGENNKDDGGIEKRKIKMQTIALGVKKKIKDMTGVQVQDTDTYITEPLDIVFEVRR